MNQHVAFAGMKFFMPMNLLGSVFEHLSGYKSRIVKTNMDMAQEKDM